MEESPAQREPTLDKSSYVEQALEPTARSAADGAHHSYHPNMAAQGGDPGEGVAARIERLNHDFYRLDPATYFLFRLRNLVLSAGRGLELEQLLGAGVEVGVFALSAPEESEIDSLDDEQKEAQHAFVTLETEVLLHHVSETLLRLYLAHEPDPPCPWISVSRERSPGRFKRKVSALSERLQTTEGEEALARVLLGTTDRTTFGETAPSADQWTELIDSSRLWVSWFARYMLDGDVYNAAKHGLGVHPSRSALKVEVDGQAFLEGSGPTLEFLQSARDEDGARHWRRTKKWVHWDRLFGAVHIACQLIDRLWAVAGHRYGQTERLDLELRIFAAPVELLGSEGMELSKLSRPLGFDAESLS